MAATLHIDPTTKLKTKITREVMRKLPKAELHRHLDGSVRVSTIIELAREQGVKLPSFDEAELRSLVSVDETCQSLEQYLRGFAITLSVLQRSYAITRVMYEACEDAWRDGIKYLEIRFSPVLHLQEGLDQGRVMEAVCEGLSLARYHYPIMCQIIVCAMRQLPSTETQNIAQIAWRYRHKGVCGFDLAGPELGFSSKLHRAAFDIVRAKCVNCTLHSGEAAGWESIQDSIRYCGANRIGHGVRLIQNPKLMDFVISHRIAIECCPTSNVHTKAVANILEHPIRKFFDAGALVVPCTDNTTVSSCDLTGEYMLLQEKFGFGVEEIVRLIDYGFQAAFVTATEKRRLRADALWATLKILKSDGYDTTGILKQEVYYRSIGVDFAQLDLPQTPKEFMGQRQKYDPKLLTDELIRAIPKTDLHARLDGSVCIDLLWQELHDAQVDLTALAGREIKTKEELLDLLVSAEANQTTHVAKDITKVVLQTPGQIERAVENVLSTAHNDGVTYIELAVRPITHTTEGLSPITVMDIIVAKCHEVQRKLKIKVGVVVYVSVTGDDPIVFREMAQLTVDYQQRRDSLVVGFGVYGDFSIPTESLRFFMSTFEYLKSHNVNVSMVAGLSGVGTILSSVHDAGASRISGAFQLHTFPRLMNYLATRGIAVELSLTPKLLEFTKDLSIKPLRLYIDNNVPVTICSFRSLFLTGSRTATLQKIIADCKLNVPELLRLISNGFQYNFQNYTNQQELEKDFWVKSKEILQKQGITDLFDVGFFPSI
jgi:adenosine deaminase